MQEYFQDQLVKSEIGRMDKLLNTAGVDLKKGTADSVTIANFAKGDRIRLKGLTFKIIRVRPERKQIVLRML